MWQKPHVVGGCAHHRVEGAELAEMLPVVAAESFCHNAVMAQAHQNGGEKESVH